MTTQKAKRKPVKKQSPSIRRLFTVVHHRHTGKLVHRRHTSFPALLLVILAVAILTMCTHHVVSAAEDTIQVTATVPAASVATPATINSPIADTVFTKTPIIVTGECQPQTYIVLLRNGFESGTALCKSDWTYSLSIDLFEGLNELIARIYNFTDMQGPDSTPVSVTYTPPVVGKTDTPALPSQSDTISSSTDSAGTSIAEPFIIKNDYVYRGFYNGKTAQWRVQIEGGTAPYVVNVDWGDTQSTKYGMKQSGPLDISHVYTTAKEYQNTYVVKLVATDNKGKQTYMQFPAIINNPLKTTASIGFPISMSFDQATEYSWSAYILVAMVVLAFWVVQHRENLREATEEHSRKHKNTHHRHRPHHA